MDLEHTYSIEQLMEGCKRGEPKAQELLYRRLATQMFSVCLRYAASDFEAEDMMQAGFVKVFRNMSHFRGEGSFEGWIRRIMVNTAIEVYRKNLRSLKTINITEVFDHEQQTFDTDGLEAEDLMKLIQQLPDGYRIVFNMYAIEGYSHQEIATTLQISEGASKSQLSRARAWLRNKLITMEGEGNYGTYAG